jgi:hypothetical protein
MVAVSAVVKGRNFNVSQREIKCFNAIGSEIISTQFFHTREDIVTYSIECYGEH